MEILFFWLMCAVLGGAVLSRYDKAGTGFLLGAILGPFGVLFALIMRSGESQKEEQKRHDEQIRTMTELSVNEKELRPERECPFCAEKILAKAKICKHCGGSVSPID